MKHLVRTHATLGLAASGKAARSLFGHEWEKDPRWCILHCGVDLRPFSESVNRSEVRSELGIPQDAFVVGHVGRFSEQKNHVFIVDIAVELVKRDLRMRLLLIGDGPLRPAIEEKIDRHGLSGNVLLTGLRDDVPRLMMGAMDVFILPSLWEGMPLVSTEAQAANIPCIFSDVITEEADVVPHLIYRVPLKENANKWADIILNARGKTSVLKNQPLEIVNRCSFDIKFSINQLREVYISEVKNYGYGK